VVEAARKGSKLLRDLQTSVDHSTVLEVRGRGLMLAIDFRDSATANRVYTELIDRGFIVGNRGNFLRVDPPLTIVDGELKRFAGAFAEIVSEIARCEN
ncbi:MAG: aminotransferase class III-fold pyridoxal phosphate-dependent enzyme, partial [Spirochaetales bacterium]|nr:aminotransferase class III-fold pyridoxal phosphate-dependent enzyme [Spirochaetales bacterium]